MDYKKKYLKYKNKYLKSKKIGGAATTEVQNKTQTLLTEMGYSLEIAKEIELLFKEFKDLNNLKKKKYLNHFTPLILILIF